MMMRRILALSACIFSLSALGQQSEVFSDAYGTRGEILYTGVLYDSILPEKGMYELRWREFSDSLFVTYHTKGRLKNHHPEGSWTWEEANWSYDIKPGAETTPVFQTHGERVRWEGGFTDGNPNGNWKLRADSIQPVKPATGQALQIAGIFKNGILTGHFTITDTRPKQPFKLTGNCDEKGVATGKWIFEYGIGASGSARQERHYRQGFLIKAVTHLSDTMLIDEFPEIATQLDALGNKDNPLEYLIGEDVFDNDGLDGKAIHLLNETLREAFFGGWEHPQFHHHVKRGGAWFKQMQYPFSEKEKSNISAAENTISTLLDEITIRLSYRNIEINRGRADSLDLALAYLESAATRLTRMDSLLKLTAEPGFTYRKPFGNEMSTWKKALQEPSRARAINTPTLGALLPSPVTDHDTASIYLEIKTLSDEFAEVLPEYFALVDINYEEIRQATAISTLSDELTAHISLLDSLYEPHENTGAWIHIKWVNRYLREELIRFSQAESYDRAFEIAERLIVKMDSLAAWSDQWKAYDQMPSNLKEQYTVFAYNPYTGKRDIEVRLKKRFYNTLVSHIWPWIQSELREADTWEKFSESWLVTRAAYSDLLSFAQESDQDTRRVEKRIRKEKDPERMLRLLHDYMESR